MDHVGHFNVSIHPSNLNLYYTSAMPRRSKIFYYDELSINEANELESLSSTDPGAPIPDQFKDNKHYGKFSSIAKKKCSTAIDYLVYLASDKKVLNRYSGKFLKFKLNFVTLTLSSPQIHSDNEIKCTCLQPFINSLRQKWNVQNYVWRSEKQKNGSLHFHLITDRFIPWSSLRDVWNRCQEKLGYCTRYRENQIIWHRDGFHFRPELAAKWDRAAQFKAYKAGLLHDWHNPNSSDVHSLRLITNVRAYMVKYITKASQGQNIEGRLWGCSSNLSNIKGAISETYYTLSDEISRFFKDERVRVYSTEHFTCAYFEPGLLLSAHYPEILALFDSYIQSRFPEYRPKTLFT
jgi:hypothetical protein